jgi:uncharacterized membrane protein YkvA (DUF1232 family)
VSFVVSLSSAEENLSEQTASIPEAAALDWRVTDAILAIARRWPGYLKLAWALVRDSRVPAAARRWLVAAGLYNLSPLDPIPGVIPVLGQLDDYAVLLLAIRKALRALPPDLRQEHMDRHQVTESQIDQDLREMRRIAGHITRRAAWGVWAGLRFATGVGLELGRQLLIGATRVVRPLPQTPAGPLPDERRRNPPLGVELDSDG